MEIIFFSSLCTSGRKLRSPNRNVHTGTVLYLRMFRTRTCKFLLEGTNLGASVRIPVSNKQRYPSVVSIAHGLQIFLAYDTKGHPMASSNFVFVHQSLYSNICPARGLKRERPRQL